MSLHSARASLPRMSNISPLAEILALPVQERIRYAELIWDSIAASPESLTLSDAQRLELSRRMAAWQAAPDAGLSWEQIKAQVSSGAWRTG